MDACVAFAVWMESEVDTTGVDVEELLLLAPPRGAMAPTVGLRVVGNVGTGDIVGCIVVEVDIGNVAVVALMLVVPISVADEDWAKLGTAEEREDVELGIYADNTLVIVVERSIPGFVDEDTNRRVVEDT